MVRRNVELKAHDPDPEATAERCRQLGAEDRGVLVQRDTYFVGRRGRLKLREEEGQPAQLIAYRRADTTEPEQSRYVLAEGGDARQTREALDAALGTLVTVTKRRRLFLLENVRIHLDEVDGLGTFLELEAVLDGDGEAATEAGQAKVAELRRTLAIADDALVAAGYSDLLRDGPEALLQAAESVMRHAYAPYSRFPVGAAVRGRSGAIYSGANVENVAFPQGQCAEASALAAMVAAGETEIAAVAVVAERVEHCPPCGGCRQRLAEFGRADTPVHLGRPGAPPMTVTLAELLPHSFSRAELDA